MLSFALPLQIDVPPRQFPVLGNSLAVGSVSLFHIVFASLAVAFMFLGPIAEALGRSRPGFTEAAQALARFTVVTFTVSLVLAVIMVELFIGLYPLTNAWLFNQFRYPAYLGVGAFLLQLFLLYPYYHYWDRLRARSVGLHIAMGGGAAALMLVWVGVLDGIGSYMLTPVQKEGAWDVLSNPTWLPLMLHRFVGNLVLAGFAIAAYGAWRLGRRGSTEDERYYLALVKIGYAVGIVTLLLQPFTGLVYALQIESRAPEAFQQIVRGRYRWLVYLQFGLIALVLYLAHVFLRRSHSYRLSRVAEGTYLLSLAAMAGTAAWPEVRRLITFAVVAQTLWHNYRQARPFAAAAAEAIRRPFLRGVTVSLGVLAVLIYLTMGTIRETARRPDTVKGLISLDDEPRGAGKTTVQRSAFGGGAEPEPLEPRVWTRDPDTSDLQPRTSNVEGGPSGN